MQQKVSWNLPEKKRPVQEKFQSLNSWDTKTQRYKYTKIHRDKVTQRDTPPAGLPVSDLSLQFLCRLQSERFHQDKTEAASPWHHVTSPWHHRDVAVMSRDVAVTSRDIAVTSPWRRGDVTVTSRWCRSDAAVTSPWHQPGEGGASACAAPPAARPLPSAMGLQTGPSTVTSHHIACSRV